MSRLILLALLLAGCGSEEGVMPKHIEMATAFCGASNGFSSITKATIEPNIRTCGRGCYTELGSIYTAEITCKNGMKGSWKVAVP
jgi:hypothetical protein